MKKNIILLILFFLLSNISSAQVLTTDSAQINFYKTLRDSHNYRLQNAKFDIKLKIKGIDNDTITLSKLNPNDSLEFELIYNTKVIDKKFYKFKHFQVLVLYPCVSFKSFYADKFLFDLKWALNSKDRKFDINNIVLVDNKGTEQYLIDQTFYVTP